ncbi:MAG: hypothetical protein JWO38_6451 [Gemmataceae bacterium]|nr:hypothetical protein [Gemmataceae bacterium]
MAADNTPGRSNLPVWLVTLLAVAGAVLFGLPSDPTPKPTARTGAESPDAEKPTTGTAPPPTRPDPLVVLKDFFGARPEPATQLPEWVPFWRGTPAPAPAADTWLADALGRSKTIGVDFKFEFLIATVPDPVDSKFALEFDATVEAIQRAFEARRFLLQTSWLPWPRDARGRVDLSGKTRPPHRDYPGTMLFRLALPAPGNTRPEDHLALVCLVGENPISGVHKPALIRALAVHEALVRNGVGWAGPGPTAVETGWSGAADWARTIRVVGPYYSGSLTRLVRTFANWKAEPKTDRAGYAFRILSGSGTALTPEVFPDFKIQATVVPDRLVTRAVLAYLAGYRGTDLDAFDAAPLTDRVAVLRETNTVLGARSNPDRTKVREEQAKEAAKAAGGGPATQPVHSWDEVIDLPFPISVSQLNAKYEKTAPARPWSGLPQTDFTEPRLPVREGTQVDGIAPYDPEAAVTVAGQTLRSILATIERARARYVGIVATDARDVVFLNKLIRQECPNVRVFTTEPSVAMTHPEDAYHLRGTVVGSTYPLSQSAAWWTTPLGAYARADGREVDLPNRRLPFPTQASQGYYNAVLVQFGEHTSMIGYQPPFPGGAALPGRPPIWVSVVGQGGTFLPVHCYTRYDDRVPKVDPDRGPASFLPDPYVVEAKLPEPAAGEYGPHLPRSFTVPLGGLLTQLAAVVWVGLAILVLLPPPAVRPRRGPDRWTLSTWCWRDWAAGRRDFEVNPATPAGLRLPAAAGAWLWRGVMLAAVLVFALPCALPVREAGGQLLSPQLVDWRHTAAIGLATAIGVGVIAITLLLLLRARFPHPGEWPGGYLCLLGVVLAAALPIVVWGASLGPAERFFLYFRATVPAAGYSPIVPMGLVAAAGLAVGYFSLQQTDMARRGWLRCPYRAPWGRVSRADEQLNRSCQSVLPGFLAGEGRRRPEGPVPRAVGLGLARLLRGDRVRRALDLPHRLPPVRGGGPLGLGHAGPVLGGGRGGRTRPGPVPDPLVRHPGAARGDPPGADGRGVRAGPGRDRPAVRRVPVFRPPAALPPGGHRLGPPADRAASARGGDRGESAGPDLGVRPHGAAGRARPRREFRRGRGHPGVAVRPAGGHRRTAVGRAAGPVGPPVGRRRLRGDPPRGGERGRRPPRPARAHGRRGRSNRDLSHRRVRAARPPEAADEGEQAEQFVACYVVLYLGRYFAQLRMLAYALAVAAPLLLFAAASYPFQPDRPRLDALAALLIAAVVGTVYVLYGINRDGLVSRITRSPPDRFTPDSGFFSSVAKFVLPVLAVILAQVFGLFRFILEPILGLFH